MGVSKNRIRFGLRSAGLLAVFLGAIFFAGCIAAIPLAVYYFQTDDNYVAEADARRSADEVWAEIVRIAKEAEAESRIEILEIDDKERLLRHTDGVQTAEIKIIPLEETGAKKSRITVIATVPKGEAKRREKTNELAARIVKRLCEEAKAGCKLIEE